VISYKGCVYICPRGQRGYFSATDFNAYGTIEIASGAPIRVDGKMTASDLPGIDIKPNFDVLGDTALYFVSHNLI